MSAEASAWCWKHSPLEGMNRLLHLAVADVVNDTYGNVFFMSATKLAEKAGCGRQKASEWLWQMVMDGWFDLVKDNRATTDPATGRKNVPSHFRFRFEQRTEESSVATDDAAASPGTTQDPLFSVATDDAAASPQTTLIRNSRKKNSSTHCDRAAFGTLSRREDKILDHLLALWDTPHLTPTQAGHVGGAVRWIGSLPSDDEADDDGIPLPSFRDRVTFWSKWNEPTKLRQRVPLYDAVAVATGKWWEPRTPAEEARLGCAVAGISKARGTPEQVFDRARIFPTAITKGNCTAKALEANWGQLGAAVARERHRPQPQELIMTIGQMS